MSLFDGLIGCQAGVCGRGVTDMMMVKTPKQELDEGIRGWICNSSKTPLECLLINGVRFINKWVDGCWAELILKIINDHFQWPPWGEVGGGI